MKNKKLKGFSLVEILLSISIFVVTIAICGTMVLESVRSVKNQTIRLNSTYRLKEMFNALSIAKTQLWLTIVENTGLGPMHMVFSDGKYSMAAGEETVDGISHWFTIEPVYRDVNGNIVESGGIEDLHSRKIVLNANWQDLTSQQAELNTVIYVTDWNTSEWTMSSQADFDTGTFVDTVSTNNLGGEVVLGSVFFPDWCKPTLQMNSYDIPGNAYVRSVTGFAGRAFFGTGGNASGTAYTDVAITGVDNPTIAVRDTYNESRVNDIFAVGNFSYLASTAPNEEIKILDTTNVPSVKVGGYNTPDTKPVSAVYVSGSRGYVAAGQNVFVFDLTSNTGSRSTLGSIKIALNANYAKSSSVGKIVVKGNYLYATLIDDWYEFVIVDVTDPSNMQIVSQTSINNQQPGDIYVNNDTTRTYIATSSSATEPEVYILDTTEKAGVRPIISSFDSNGMTVNAIAVVEEDQRIIIAGSSGIEYQVYNSSDESAPVLCGSMEYTTEIYDIFVTYDNEGNSFTYLVTADPLNDFVIFRGGPGGGGNSNTGWGYPFSGSYTSPVYDSGAATSKYYYLDLSLNIPANTDLRFQMRAGESADLSAQPWIGPDGTGSSYFTSITNNSLLPLFQLKRYIQYRAYFISDSVSTPELRSTNVTYQQ